MFYLPVTLLLFLLLLLLLPFIWLMLAVDIVEIAVAKLGFSPSVAGIVLALVILGSTINILLYRVESPTVLAENFTNLWLREFWGIPLRKIQHTIVAVNVGGGLIPVGLALYQFTQGNSLAILLALLGRSLTLTLRSVG